MRMKYLLSVAMFMFFFATQSNAQLRVSGGTVLGIDSEFLTGINASVLYVGEGDLDYGAGYTYWLTDETFMALDLDAYYLLTILGADSDVYISPFGGLNTAISERFSDANEISITMSLNLGVSFKKELGDRMIFFEPKVLLGGNPDMVFKAGLLF